jgi:hypothetical protein
VPLAQAVPVHWRLDLSAPAARPPLLLRRWGQQPTLYKATWERFTSILRANTQYATMLWAPNEGGGYPYAGGRRGTCAAACTCAASCTCIRPTCCACCARCTWPTHAPAAPRPPAARRPPPAAANPLIPQLNCADASRQPECAVMDTNGDGAIDMYDDMYTPYYPGDDWVDWVGMSIFHFGKVRARRAASAAPCSARRCRVPLGAALCVPAAGL